MVCDSIYFSFFFFFFNYYWIDLLEFSWNRSNFFFFLLRHMSIAHWQIEWAIWQGCLFLSRCTFDGNCLTNVCAKLKTCHIFHTFILISWKIVHFNLNGRYSLRNWIDCCSNRKLINTINWIRIFFCHWKNSLKRQWLLLQWHFINNQFVFIWLIEIYCVSFLSLVFAHH